jgi:hypothetical protein
MVVVVTVVLVVVIGAILYARKLADLGLAAARRLHLVPKPEPVPPGRPIQEIAADVGRLRQQLRHVPAGTPVAKLEGWRLAYDDVLAECCLALGVENLLDSTPAGPERDAERLRVEYLLGRAGLRAFDDVA